MTFYEAAVEVLRDAGRPLHYKKIAAQAIEQSLLSHVGRDPYETMNARLNQEVQKKSGDTLVKLVRPGVYELKKGVDTADAKQTIQLRKVEPIVEPEWESEEDDDDSGDDDDEEEEEQSSDENSDAEDKKTKQRRRSRGRPRSGRSTSGENGDADGDDASGGDTNDDDGDDGDDDNAADDGNEVGRGIDRSAGDDADDNNDGGESADDGDEDSSTDDDGEQRASSGRRRSRGRRKRGGRDDAETQSSEGVERAEEDPGAGDVNRGGDTPPESTAPDVGDTQADDGEQRDKRGRRGRRGRGGDERGRRGRGRRGRGRGRPTTDQAVVQPGESSDGDGELATKIATLLEKGSRRGWTQRKIAKALAEQPGIEAATDTMVRSVLEAANERRAAAGHTPLFTEMKPGTWALAAASSEQLARSYSALSTWQAQHRGLLIDELAARIGDFDSATVRSTLLLVLERLGYRDIEAMAHGSTWLATVSVGMSDDRVAVRIHDEGETDIEHVDAFREDLIDAGAVSGVLLTTSGSTDGAVENADGTQPRISVIDSDAFAEWMLRAGVGVAKMNLNVNCLDDAFFAS